MKKASKFKVGDLVMLSAAGQNTQQNHHLLDGWGIITEIGIGSTTHYPIKAQWYESSHRGVTTARFKPYELKFFKKKS